MEMAPADCGLSILFFGGQQCATATSSGSRKRKAKGTRKSAIRVSTLEVRSAVCDGDGTFIRAWAGHVLYVLRDGQLGTRRNKTAEPKCDVLILLERMAV